MYKSIGEAIRRSGSGLMIGWRNVAFAKAVESNASLNGWLLLSECRKRFERFNEASIDYVIVQDIGMIFSRCIMYMILEEICNGVSRF